MKAADEGRWIFECFKCSAQIKAEDPAELLYVASKHEERCRSGQTFPWIVAPAAPMDERIQMCSCGHTRGSHSAEGCIGCAGPLCDDEMREILLANVLREGDELAFDNIHADWARRSIARTILNSAWWRMGVE